MVWRAPRWRCGKASPITAGRTNFGCASLPARSSARILRACAPDWKPGASAGVRKTCSSTTKQQGGFKTPFLQGGSDTWVASLNLEFDLPIGIPLSLFASAGAVPITTISPDGRSTSTAGYAEAGIGIQVMRDVIELWVPLFVSERIADEEEFLDRGIGDRIRLVFALEKLDPTRLLRRVRP